MPAKLPDSIIEQALELQALCWSQKAIAQHLGVNYITLHRRLQAFHKATQARLQKKKAAEVGKQFLQLERIAHEALRAYERSQQPAKTLKQIKSPVAPAPRKKARKGEPEQPPEPAFEERTEITLKDQAGDPSYLNTALAALADQRKLLGLDHKEAGATITDRPRPRIEIPDLDPTDLAADDEDDQGPLQEPSDR